MNAYSQDLRDKLIRLYKTGNYTRMSLSKLFELSYITVQRWCTKYDATGECKVVKPLKEGRRRLFDDKEAILNYLGANPAASGKEMHASLAPHVTSVCFYMTLKRLDIIYKKEVKYKNRCEKKRGEFSAQIEDININKLIYIDETGIDNNISKIRGWAEKGVKSFTQALGFRTKRSTLIAGYCYGSKQLIAPMQYDGYTNTEVFLAWVEHGLCKELEPNGVVIMDNASFHK